MLQLCIVVAMAGVVGLAMSEMQGPIVAVCQIAPERTDTPLLTHLF